MKPLIKLSFLSLLMAAVITSCTKVAGLQMYANGAAPVLTSSTNTIVPKASDSTTVVLTLKWTDPKYSTDSSTEKYIIEVDSTNMFLHPVIWTINGRLNETFTALQLNNVLANFGFAPGKPFNVNIRITSSYANNNERYRSNVVVVAMTPYLVPITLSSSVSSALTLQISNATSTGATFNWNASPYGSNTISYAMQFDTVGGNFAKPQVFQYGTSLNSSIVVNDLNTAAINTGVYGGSTKNVEFRIVSYQGTGYSTPLVYSNAITFSLTTYVPVPPNLYIVGDATPGGWNNPVPTPSQQFTKIDAVSFGLIINLTANKSYLFLPKNGDWGHKYGGASATGGTLLADGQVPGSNTPAPATTGTYEIVINFQTNSYTVTPYTGNAPTNLYIVGDATPGSWANPVPTPTQQFTPIDNSSFGIILSLTAGKSYLFLPKNGDWGHKFGGSTDGTTTGALLADGAVPGSNTPAPTTSGVYQIVVNFLANTYTVTPYSGPTLPANIVPNPGTLQTGLWLVGDATPAGWNNTPGALASQHFTQIDNAHFQLSLALASDGGKSYLFLPAAGDWGNKYGGKTDGTQGAGTLLFNGAVPGSNTPPPAAAGNYLIDVNFLTGSYTLTKQ